MAPRYLYNWIEEDLNERMVFIGGPRQVGKTTLSLDVLADPRREQASTYLNWDLLADREKILTDRLPVDQPRIVLDEIHKFADWRRLVKGIYDKNRSSLSVIVTGSARLDHYRKGGDSLQGRYNYYRLHPFSIPEWDSACSEKSQQLLLKFGGFPEPLTKATERFHRRWQREMFARVLNEDLRELENVQESSRLELLLAHLPECVGSPLSVNQLRKLLQVAHSSVERWLTIFENLYLTFRISPYGTSRIRAVKKEQKLYFRDWSRVSDPGARFENMAACHLLKYCDFIEDTQGHHMELRYLRDTDAREVDFVVLRDGKPEFAVECKCGDRELSPACAYFRERSDIPEFYQVHLESETYGNPASGTQALPFHTFCHLKKLP
ncbi:MAG: ATP-binding protein [Lentisphaeria bacterium]|nr:ATP-binding protein [Lentisphaeria bacterium]